jgi:hypothetical protein
MDLITSKIKNFLIQQKLGYVATVSSDGMPNISPKGTIVGWDSETLVFANIRSPDTIDNLKNNPNVEINVIDPILRKGYLFSGVCTILTDGNLFDDIFSYYRNYGVTSMIHSIVLVKLSKISPVTSPLYDMGISEDEMKLKWKTHFEIL